MQIITNQFQKELKQHGNEQFPFLVSYQKLSEYESGSFMWHWHPEIEITYVQKGTMCYKVNHMVYLTTPVPFTLAQWKIRRTALIFL